MLTGYSGGVGTGVAPHFAALRPSETVGRPHCSAAPAAGSSDSGSGDAVPSLCCFHLLTARQGERKAVLGLSPEPWLFARESLGRLRALAGSPVAGKKGSGCWAWYGGSGSFAELFPGRLVRGACCSLGPLLLPADIWGFDPFFFNLLLLRCIS